MNCLANKFHEVTGKISFVWLNKSMSYFKIDGKNLLCLGPYELFAYFIESCLSCVDVLHCFCYEQITSNYFVNHLFVLVGFDGIRNWDVLRVEGFSWKVEDVDWACKVFSKHVSRPNSPWSFWFSYL